MSKFIANCVVISTVLTVSILASRHAAGSLAGWGEGLIYDDVLDITWLQNANLAATETFGVAAIDGNGYMNWPTAQTWVSAMNAANYLGASDRRLPVTDGTFGLR